MFSLNYLVYLPLVPLLLLVDKTKVIWMKPWIVLCQRTLMSNILICRKFWISKIHFNFILLSPIHFLKLVVLKSHDSAIIVLSVTVFPFSQCCLIKVYVLHFISEILNFLKPQSFQVSRWTMDCFQMILVCSIRNPFKICHGISKRAMLLFHFILGREFYFLGW